MTELQKPNRIIEAGFGRFGHAAHADNLVNWHPFGQETFDKAKRENKPLFLSIGFP